MSVCVIALIAVLAMAAARKRAAAELPPGGMSTQTITVDGRERRYLLYAPHNAASLPGRRPLVLVLHGGGGTADQIAAEAGKTLTALADADGAYLAFPDAVNKMWDLGGGAVSESLRPRIDDRKFFEQLLDTLVTERPIDASRIFATGISRGGQASYFLACAFPGRISAIAPVAMSLPRYLHTLCADIPPVGVAIFNGTSDPLVPYDGGQIAVFRKKRDVVSATDETVSFWRERNGCTDDFETEHIDRIDDGMHVEKQSWRACRGAPVVLFRIVGGGHTWPSGRQYLPAFIVGKVNRDIDAGAEIWAFFRNFN